jgi:hypothetical protein
MSDPQKPDKTVMERKESTTTAAKAVSEKSTKRSFWSKKHAVYATGFPFTARSDEIKNFFYSCTDFKNLKKQIDDTKRWSGAVVVFFKSEKGVEDALQLNKELWHGTGEDGERFISIAEFDQKKKRKKVTQGKAHVIFIGGLKAESEVSEIQLCKAIARKLEVKDVGFGVEDYPFRLRLALDNKKLSRGFGHVEFDQAEHKELCLKIKSFRLDEETYVTMRNPSTPEKREREEKRKEVKKAAKKEKLNLKRKRDQEKKDAIPKGFKGGKSSDKKDKKFKKSKPSSK